MSLPVDFSLKNRVIGIGGLHVVVLVYALFQSIYNIIEEERPVTDGDILYTALQIALHLFLICTLVTGANTGNQLLLLPWLVVTFPVFISVSYFTLKYSSLGYLSQFLFNIFFICVGWYMWFTVFRLCRHCKSTKVSNQRIEKT